MSVIENFCKIYTDICQISPADLENIYSKRITFVDPITTHEGIEQVKAYFNNQELLDSDVMAKRPKLGEIYKN